MTCRYLILAQVSLFAWRVKLPSTKENPLSLLSEQRSWNTSKRLTLLLRRLPTLGLTALSLYVLWKLTTIFLPVFVSFPPRILLKQSRISLPLHLKPTLTLLRTKSTWLITSKTTISLTNYSNSCLSSNVTSSTKSFPNSLKKPTTIQNCSWMSALPIRTAWYIILSTI